MFCARFRILVPLISINGIKLHLFETINTQKCYVESFGDHILEDVTLPLTALDKVRFVGRCLVGFLGIKWLKRRTGVVVLIFLDVWMSG